MSEVKKKRRFGLFRWIVLALIFIGIYFAYLGPSIFKPVRPPIALPSEVVWPGLEVLGVPLTNTMLATLIADVILIWMALRVRAFVKSGKMVPSGVSNFFEFIFEFLWNAVEGATGKWARRVIPLVATIFMLIFVANLIKMVPGFESIGYLESPRKVRPTRRCHRSAFSVILSIRSTRPTGVVIPEDEKPSEGSEAAPEEGAHELCKACQVVPFLRGSATD